MIKALVKRLILILHVLIAILVILGISYFIWLLIPPQPALEKIKIETLSEKPDIFFDDFLLSPDEKYLLVYDDYKDRIALFDLKSGEEKIIKEKISPKWVYLRSWLNYDLIYVQEVSRYKYLREEYLEDIEDIWESYILNLSDLSWTHLTNTFLPQFENYQVRHCSISQKEKHFIADEKTQKEIVKTAKLIISISYPETDYCVDDIYRKYQPTILALDSYSKIGSLNNFQIISPNTTNLLREKDYLSFTVPSKKIKIGKKIYSPDKKYYFILTTKNPLFLKEANRVYLDIFRQDGQKIGRYLPNYSLFETLTISHSIFWFSNNQIILTEDGPYNIHWNVIKKISF